MCYVTHVKEPRALIEKRRGSPRCSWSDRQQIAPQHLVKHYMVLSELGLIIQNIVPHLAGNTVCYSAGASLSDGHVCYIKSHNYYNYIIIIIYRPIRRAPGVQVLSTGPASVKHRAPFAAVSSMPRLCTNRHRSW